MARSWQVRRIERQQRDPGQRRDLMRKVVHRHPTPEGGLHLRSEGRNHYFVRNSELLARTEQLTDRAREVIAAAGFRADSIAELQDKVTRIHQPAATQEQVDALRAELGKSGVAASLSYVTPNMVIDKSDATPEKARRRRATTLPEVDRAVQVAILDTGINVADRDDGWLAGLLDPSGSNADPLDVVEPLGRLDWAAGHGTFIAGQYRQYDPALDLHVSQVLNTDGVASEVDVAVAMVQTAKRHLRRDSRLLINLSLGTDTIQQQEPLALRVAAEILGDLQRQEGGEVMLVCAAGNDGSDTRCWPASFADADLAVPVVAVAAMTPDYQPAKWSTKGSWVTCSAVGELVRSTYVKGTEDIDIDPDPETFDRNAWAAWTGTSFSAPLVGAAIASLARTDGISLRHALRHLLRDKGMGTEPGYGVLLDLDDMSHN